MTPAAARMLAMLQANPGHWTRPKLAGSLGVSESRVSALLLEIRSDGLEIQGRPGRRGVVSYTVKGRARSSALEGRVKRLCAEAFPARPNQRTPAYQWAPTVALLLERAGYSRGRIARAIGYSGASPVRALIQRAERWESDRPGYAVIVAALEEA